MKTLDFREAMVTGRRLSNQCRSKGFILMTLECGLYLECAVMSLQLPAETLQLAASQDGLAVFVPQVVFLLDNLVLLFLQHSHLLLGVTVLLQLSQTHTYCLRGSAVEVRLITAAADDRFC